MDAITALHSRNSAARLSEPAPQGAARENIFKAALRAPDHSWLRPFRFLVLEGESRERLGQLFVKATNQDDPTFDSAKAERLAGKPLRAPMIIIVVAKTQQHPKVPEQEQLLSAGAAAQNILLAAHAEGFGGIWRTGDMAYHPIVKEGLGLGRNEHIIGYLYIGTVVGGYKPLPDMAVKDYFQSW